MTLEIDPRDPRTWPRHADLVQQLEKAAVEAEWNGHQDEANRLFRQAEHHKKALGRGEDRDVPF